MTKTKKKFKVPHSYVIVFILLIAVSIMTYLIPANEYDRTETESGTTTVIVESYHSVEGDPVPIWEIPNYIMQGLINQADIIFPLLVNAGDLEVIRATRMFHAYCGKLAMKCKGKEKLFIPAILLIFAFIGITQSTNKFIGFAPLGVMLAATLGYDAIVGVAIVLLGVGIGFSTGILAPTTAVAQELAELQAYSGMWLRVVSFILFYIVTAAYIIWYGERCKKDPTKSVVYGQEGVQQFDLSDTQREVEKRHPLVFIVFIASFAILMYGCITMGWGLVETAVCLFWMALVGGLVYGFTPSQIATNFVKGAKNMTPAAFIVGLGATVSLILSSANVLDTVVYSLANVLNLFPAFLKPAVMLFMNVIVNGFVTSGTGQAAVVMPVMVPLADVAGVTRQTAVLAYKFGDGFCNYVLPHASALMGFLGATGITYDRWMKFMGKLFGLWMLLGCAILTFAYFVQYS
ncbi:MAG: AbgT family transporter [Lachnospiraceae bacterium]|nr:AbgT family transporter [Lachnospiraceae bacterium]